MKGLGDMLQVPLNVQWGDWFLEGYQLVNKRRNYKIDLSTCTDSANVTDWIFHCNTKGMDTQGLVNAFEELLRPRANICSGGYSKECSPIDLVRQHQKRLKDSQSQRAITTKQGR